MQNPPPAQSAGGVDKRTGATLSYLLWWVTGIIFLFVGKNDPDIKFHAAQSIVFFAPISIIGALVLVSQGVIDNFSTYLNAHTVTGLSQSIAMGPVASQEVIKELGTNGGGFFNANSAHPFESPNPFTNLVQILLIFVLGAGLTYTFGHMVKDSKQGWALFWAL